MQWCNSCKHIFYISSILSTYINIMSIFLIWVDHFDLVILKIAHKPKKCGRLWSNLFNWYNFVDEFTNWKWLWITRIYFCLFYFRRMKAFYGFFRQWTRPTVICLVMTEERNFTVNAFLCHWCWIWIRKDQRHSREVCNGQQWSWGKNGWRSKLRQDMKLLNNWLCAIIPSKNFITFKILFHPDFKKYINKSDFGWDTLV